MSVILEVLTQLQLIHLKGQNDPGKEWFLLMRNNLPLRDTNLECMYKLPPSLF
jgi:hypothetical protein